MEEILADATGLGALAGDWITMDTSDTSASVSLGMGSTYGSTLIMWWGVTGVQTAVGKGTFALGVRG